MQSSMKTQSAASQQAPATISSQARPHNANKTLLSKSRRLFIGRPSRLWARNLFAISLVIAFLAGSYLVNLQAYRAATYFEEAINISGRQRMLSQRILYLSGELNGGNSAVKPKLKSAISLFENSNNELSGASASSLSGALPENIKRHYWSNNQGNGLYQQSTDFIGAARNFLNSPSTDDAAWQSVNDYGETQLLANLDGAVTLFEQSANDNTNKLISGQRYTLIFGTAMMLLMGLLIFWPSQIAVNRSMGKLKKSNLKLQKQEKALRRLAKKAKRSAFIAEIERDKAQESEQQKSEFLATVGHEIRTPLNGILGMMELLSTEQLSPEQLTKVETANASAQALLRIINDILDYSKLEQEKYPILYSKFDVRQLVNQGINLFKANAEENGNTLSLKVDKTVPLVFISDRDRVAQVLYNLLDNAIKFTKNGAITVDVAMTGTDLRISVRDNGIGIGEEDHSRIFERFTQVQSTLNRNFGGNGLGLSISKKITDLLNGSIEVESEANCGSVFKFWVPVGTPEQTASAQQDQAQHNLEPAALSVLVAEDNPTNQMLMKSMLAKLGHKPTLVDNGQEAIEKISSGRFDVVLMDIQMPTMDGLEATRTIRSMESEKSEIPIFAVTANSDSLTEEELVSIGINGCLPKPVTLKALAAVLTNTVATELKKNHSGE